jgi:N-acetylglutamate synthase-like GNAT family acetyltransferase
MFIVLYIPLRANGLQDDEIFLLQQVPGFFFAHGFQPGNNTFFNLGGQLPYSRSAEEGSQG